MHAQPPAGHTNAYRTHVRCGAVPGGGCSELLHGAGVCVQTVIQVQKAVDELRRAVLGAVEAHTQKDRVYCAASEALRDDLCAQLEDIAMLHASLASSVDTNSKKHTRRHTWRAGTQPHVPVIASNRSIDECWHPLIRALEDPHSRLRTSSRLRRVVYSPPRPCEQLVVLLTGVSERQQSTTLVHGEQREVAAPLQSECKSCISERTSGTQESPRPVTTRTDPATQTEASLHDISR
jgi:hypothetical protein